MENKSPAAVSTKPSKFGTRSQRFPVDAASTGNPHIASPKSWWCCPSYRWQFAFHRGSTPLNGPWNCEKSSHESTEPERETWKNLPIRVPGQRRLTISRLRVPNLDGAITTAAGNLLSIGAPCHRKDSAIEKSKHTNQQRQRGKMWKKTYTLEWPVTVDSHLQKNLIKKNLLARVPGHRALVNVHLETLYIYVIFKRVFINNKLPIRGVYLTGTQKRNMFFWLSF